MSKNISNYFKVVPKIKSCVLNQSDSEKSNNIKEEPEANFEIDFNKINSRIEENSSKLCKKTIQTMTKSPQKADLNLQIGCQYCDQRFAKCKSMKQHIAFKHSVELKQKHFECDFDGKVFNNRKKIFNHMKLHELKVKCEICQKFVIPKTLVEHIKNVHAIELKEKCEICQKSFKSKINLYNHKRIHNKKLECQLCYKMFSFQSFLNMHINEYHKNPNSFKCEICNKKFNKKYNLKTHQKVHNKIRLKPFKCDRCDFATDNIKTFDYHQKFHEKIDEKHKAMKNPLKCEKCYKFCRNKSKLNQHLKTVHSKNPFQCDLCGKYIKTKKSLVNHIINKICQKFKI